MTSHHSNIPLEIFKRKILYFTVVGVLKILPHKKHERFVLLGGGNKRDTKVVRVFGEPIYIDNSNPSSTTYYTKNRNSEYLTLIKQNKKM